MSRPFPEGDISGYIATIAAPILTSIAAITPQAMDRWTAVVLGSDFPTSSLAPVNVTGLKFTPLANTSYEFKGVFYCRTSNVAVGPQVGCTWPTGLTDGVARITVATSKLAEALGNGDIAAEVTALATALADPTGSWPATITGMLIAGATPSGDFQIRLTASGVGTVTLKAGSVLSYRQIP